MPPKKKARPKKPAFKAAAEEDARKIVVSAEQEIAAAAKAARRQLTAYAADLAVGLARKQIHVDAATDQALVRNFAGQLGASHPTTRERTGTRAVASVASTYARAFADVVFGAHLDANREVGGLRRIVELLAESADLRRVWENPAVPAEQKRKLLDAIVQREGIERHSRNSDGGADRSPAGAFPGADRRATEERTRCAHGIRRSADHQRSATWATPRSGRSKRRSKK